MKQAGREGGFERKGGGGRRLLNLGIMVAPRGAGKGAMYDTFQYGGTFTLCRAADRQRVSMGAGHRAQEVGRGDLAIGRRRCGAMHGVGDMPSP